VGRDPTITTACSPHSAGYKGPTSPQIRQGDRQRAHQFSGISEWERCIGRDGTLYGIDLVVPNWFYTGAGWQFTFQQLHTKNSGHRKADLFADGDAKIPKV
jgi:hypothetical protein